MAEMGSDRHIWRSIGAVFAGFVVVVILSLVTDALMHAIGLFPKPGQPAAGGGSFLAATLYRSVYGILGSFITAKLAPARPMFHAMAGGAIGFVISVIGVIATWNLGPEFGPHWYPISLIVTTIPCAWLGGKLAEGRARRAN
jgi:hypothetical protein